MNTLKDLAYKIRNFTSSTGDRQGQTCITPRDKQYGTASFVLGIWILGLSLRWNEGKMRYFFTVGNRHSGETQKFRLEVRSGDSIRIFTYNYDIDSLTSRIEVR